MSGVKDYYRVLGVRRLATDQEIREAYRRLVRLYHPDVNPGDPHAEEYAKEINLAYEVLSDPRRRSEYDRIWHSSNHTASASGPQPVYASPPRDQPSPAPPHDIPTDFAPPRTNAAPARERRPWFQSFAGLLLVLGLCRGVAWLTDQVGDDDRPAVNATSAAVRATVVAEATTVARSAPMSQPTAISRIVNPTATTRAASADNCAGWNAWGDRMDLLVRRSDALAATVQAPAGPLGADPARSSEEAYRIADAVEGSLPPRAATEYVTALAGHYRALGLLYGTYSGAVAREASATADRLYTDAERLRVQANLSCAG